MQTGIDTGSEDGEAEQTEKRYTVAHSTHSIRIAKRNTGKRRKRGDLAKVSDGEILMMLQQDIVDLRLKRGESSIIVSNSPSGIIIVIPGAHAAPDTGMLEFVASNASNQSASNSQSSET